MCDISAGGLQGVPPTSRTILVETSHRLAAVHGLLSSERRVAEHDILLATCLERFRAGPATANDLLDSCRATWPGAGVTLFQVESTLSAAEAAGYVSQQLTTDAGIASWTLTGTGSSDLHSSEMWAQDALSRSRDSLRNKARSDFREISESDAELWLDIIWSAVCEGIQAAFTVYDGDVAALIDHRSLVPRQFDVALVVTRIVETPGVTAEVREFLAGIAVVALDPADSFGNELVTHITTGYLLHAFLARRDNPDARADVGSLRGMRLIIDTPWLYLSLGSMRSREAMEAAIAASIAAGVEPIVFEHSLEELTALVDRLGDTEYPLLASELTDGLALETLIALYEPSPIREYLLALNDSRVAGWDAFVANATGLRAELEGLGVTVRHHNNSDRSSDVDDAAEALRSVLEEADSGRGEEAIQRDSHTLAVARRWRGSSPTVQRGAWPSCFVVTPDRSMGPAFERLATVEDVEPLTLTPSQWVGVVGSCADPATVAELAATASDLLAREAMMSVAVKWPPEYGLAIARSLGSDSGVTSTDVRIAQLSLSEVLADQHDVLGEGAESGEKVAAALVAKRSGRIEAVHRDREDRMRSANLEQRDSLASAEDSAVRERITRSNAEKRSLELEHELREGREELRIEELLGRRRTIRTSIAVAGAFLVLSMAWNEGWVLAVGSMVAIGIYWKLSDEWVNDVTSRWQRLLIAVAVEVGVIMYQVVVG